MKNPFKSISKFFKKTIPDTAKSIFSKSNVGDFRDKLSNTLGQQGKILSTIGKIGVGITPALALTAGMLQPELIPLIAGVGLASGGIGGMGMLETAGSNLLKPSLYKGKNKLQTTSAVTNQLEKAVKGGTNVTKFA